MADFPDQNVRGGVCFVSTNGPVRLLPHQAYPAILTHYGIGILASAEMSGLNYRVTGSQYSGDIPSLENVHSPNAFYPVLLGTGFTLAADSSVQGSTDVALGLSANGYVDLSFGFRFFEADGVTPVAISETPEPATWLLLATAALALPVWRLAARNCLPS